VLRNPGVLTVFVVLCDADGRISDIVDSGKILVLPKDAAEEVSTLFAKIKEDMWQHLPSTSSSQPAPVQQQQQSGSQLAVHPLLQRTWQMLTGRPSGADSTHDAQAAVPASSSAQPAAGRPSSGSYADATSGTTAAATAVEGSTATAPDAAALYAYEHFLVPFVRHWEAVLLQRAAAQPVGPSNAAASATADALAVRLLHFMLDNELWTAAVLLLDQAPAAAEYAVQSGLGLPASFYGSITLDRMRGMLSAARVAPQQLQVPVGGQFPAAQAGPQLAVRGMRQQQQQGSQAGLTDANLQAWLTQQQQQQQQQPGFGVLRYTRQLSPVGSNELPLPSNDDSSFESASEIFRRVMLLQQLRSEQEALAECQQQQDGVNAPSATQQQCSSGSGGVNSMQLSLLQAQYAAAGPTIHQRSPSAQCAMAAAAAAAADSALAEAAAEMTTLEVAAAVAAQADAEEQDILAGMLSAEGLEGSFAVAEPCAWQQAALAAEGPAMVPKQRPPKPEHTYLEGSLLRMSSKSAAREPEVPDAGAVGSGSSFMQQSQQQQSQQQQQQQQCQGVGQQCIAAAQAAGVVSVPAAAAAAPTVLRVPVTPASTAGQQQQAAGAAVQGNIHSCPADVVNEQQQQQQQHPAAGVALPSTVGGCSTQQQQQQRSRRIENLLWQEVSAAGPAAAAHRASTCADVASSTPADSCDASGGSDFRALAEYEVSCGSSFDSYSGGAAAADAAAAAAAAVAADYQQDSCSKPHRLRQQLHHRQQLTLAQQVVGGVQLAVSGFEDPCLERSYLVFKNHSSALLDTTALLICAGMLAAATMRSVDFRRDPEAVGKLGMVMLYGAFFFLPYAVMQLRRQMFLRYREVLLVLARTMTAFILILVAVKAVPQPNAWVSVVGNTLAMQLQNGLILPSCQQLRLPAAAAIAAAHLPSDALMLALGMPVGMAVLSSVLVQLCMLLVTVAQDAWCRHKFMQRYLGAAAGAGPARPTARQVPAAAPGASAGRSCAVGSNMQPGSDVASCSSAAAALRQRRPVQ
jgi:hypothetical protein